METLFKEGDTTINKLVFVHRMKCLMFSERMPPNRASREFVQLSLCIASITICDLIISQDVNDDVQLSLIKFNFNFFLRFLMRFSFF